MKFDTPLHIAAVASSFPVAGEQTADEAAALGLAEPETLARDGYLALTAGEQPGPVLAVEAAAKALAAAGVDPTRLGLVLHAWIYHQGHDFWSPAHYVAHQVGATGAVALGIQQMCNGGAAAIDLAAARLSADRVVEHVLVTTGDRFAPPGFRRWSGDYGVSYGDGGTAVVLGRDRGPFVLLSTAATSAPELEEMHRGDDPFSDLAGGNDRVVDVRRTKKAFLTRHGSERFAEVCARSLRRVITAALEEAELRAAQIGVVTLPRLGNSVLDEAYLPTIRSLIDAPVLDFGRRTGHLGAGDAAANLAELQRTGPMEPGTAALLISGGAGFSWNCLAISPTSNDGRIFAVSDSG